MVDVWCKRTVPVFEGFCRCWPAPEAFIIGAVLLAALGASL